MWDTGETWGMQTECLGCAVCQNAWGTQAGQWWYGTHGHTQGTASVHPCIDGCDSMGGKMPGFTANSVV